jgi:rod shape determining protein RodA
MPGPWLVLLLSPLISALVAGTWAWGLIAWVPFTGWLARSSLPWKRLAPPAVIAIQGFFAAITPWLWLNVLQDYQRDRLVLFLDPAKDPLGGGYHLLQSTVGIGRARSGAPD